MFKRMAVEAEFTPENCFRPQYFLRTTTSMNHTALSFGDFNPGEIFETMMGMIPRASQQLREGLNELEKLLNRGLVQAFKWLAENPLADFEQWKAKHPVISNLSENAIAVLCIFLYAGQWKNTAVAIQAVLWGSKELKDFLASPEDRKKAAAAISYGLPLLIYWFVETGKEKLQKKLNNPHSDSPGYPKSGPPKPKD
jgi:hypothetical protein